MELKVIGSSSRGNCYILTAGNARLILECGMRLDEIKKALNFDMEDLQGCLVTHEHGDHARCAKEILQLGIDTYMSKGTAQILRLDKESCYLHHIRALEKLDIGEYTVLPFDIQHDAAEPLGFLIQYRPTGEQLVFATDTYYLKYKFSGINYFLIECNYIKAILDENIERGVIPIPVKKRTLQSHFELDNVIEFLKSSDLSQCQKIVLIHISDSNGDAKKMADEVYLVTGIDTIAADTKMTIELNENLF